ncbi:E3 ubiquitin-protein ligase SPL2-like isoform X1 [Cucurbita moschata]|uniref:RING-type E3 ubiquitin transferase n=1 Tax=Cucurbita moschata TaxID=3662 RepID=A0A6J1HH89_CUCMO|nr:E3 ubiquitin-protein ligase SPL2-like isoform X1 [Cucurbita moschata]XP_022964218.1 E3 ubiquitin-protein ligase SPL2-like isoform X1 [Cucurbita moschata]
MSSSEQALVSLFSRFALSFDGAALGAALAYAAFRTVLKLTASCSALDELRKAPNVRVSDLRHMISDGDSRQSESDQKLVVVRGTVEARSFVEGNWKSLQPNVLISQESGDRAVIIQRTQMCIFNEWKGFLGWTSDLRAIFGRTFRKQESTSFRTVKFSFSLLLLWSFSCDSYWIFFFPLLVARASRFVSAISSERGPNRVGLKVPFVLVEGHSPYSDFAVVNMDGSRHRLPLTTVYRQLQPVCATPYTFLQALFGHEYPVGVLDEEKILPLGRNISVVGVCSFKNGVPEIKSCKDFPHFLCEMTKDQMVLDLVFKTKFLFWSSIVLGSLSVGVLGCSVMRNWNRWKQWRQQRRLQDSGNDSTMSQLDSSNNIPIYGDFGTASDDEVASIPDDELSSNVPDGQLCVICLMRRRRSAFIPCGHLVCCERCAISVERDSAPKCPVCRQQIRSSVRIYDS